MSMKRKYVKNMTDQKGHFEQGRWVVESEPSATQTEGNVIDKRFSEATKSVISSVDDVMKVTHDLVTTKEGKQYIEKTLKDTQSQIQKSFDDIINRVKDEVDKKVKNLK
ncbi:MAG: hypothetical protein ACYDDV_07600 [Methanoregula sp.]